MVKRTVSLFLIIIMAITMFSFSGCSKPQVILFGEVIIIGPDGEKMLDSEIYVSKQNATAADAVMQSCAEMKFPFTCENGLFDNFGGVASTMEDGWLLYSDKELVNVGAGEFLLEDNFYIEFRYVNYAESFTLE